ncbi:MAG: hypothetical protein HOW73_37340 [Polyangiaceae bacterium]|nr:hypothetical protein [Polyangiaceae bacterium]
MRRLSPLTAPTPGSLVSIRAKGSATFAALVALLAFAPACGSSEAPEAYPGRPIDPPGQDDALLEMMAGGTSSPATAEPTAAPTAAPTVAPTATATATAAASAAPTGSASAKAPKTPKPPKK